MQSRGIVGPKSESLTIRPVCLGYRQVPGDRRSPVDDKCLERRGNRQRRHRTATMFFSIFNHRYRDTRHKAFQAPQRYRLGASFPASPLPARRLPLGFVHLDEIQAAAHDITLRKWFSVLLEPSCVGLHARPPEPVAEDIRTQVVSSVLRRPTEPAKSLVIDLGLVRKGPGNQIAKPREVSKPVVRPCLNREGNSLGNWS